MIKVISKPVHQISLSDIESLIKDKVPEGERIEYKENLSAKKGGKDSWSSNQSRINDGARNSILEEVVAFANAFGGCLLLGIKESKSNPPCASELISIPRCNDLAERFKLIFRDCVEPEIPQLEIFAIPTCGENGVVIFRTGRSSQAPHRVKTTQNCPVRRSNRKETMSMREIQDMTLNLSRGLERLKLKLSAQSENFKAEFSRLASPENAFGLRITAAPVRNEINLNSVFRNNNIIEELRPPWVELNRKTAKECEPIPLVNLVQHHNLVPSNWRPKLRAARGDAYHQLSNMAIRYAYQEIHQDGMLESGFLSVREFNGEGLENYKRKKIPEQFPCNCEIAVSMFAQVMKWISRIRTSADTPFEEYAVEVEIVVKGGLVKFSLSGTYPYQSVVGNLSVGNHRYPLYHFKEPKEDIDLVALFEQDLWNMLGRDLGDSQGCLEIIVKNI